MPAGGISKTFCCSTTETEECKGSIQSAATPLKCSEPDNLSTKEKISPIPCIMWSDKTNPTSDYKDWD